MLSAAERSSKIKATIRVASCNFIEAYDFIVYGYYAVYIGRTFFPNDSEFASLMLSLVTFGIGYLVRPLGAILLGAYMDRKGRRKGLITLSLMAVGTFLIGDAAMRNRYHCASDHRRRTVAARSVRRGGFGGVAIYSRDRHAGKARLLLLVASGEPTGRRRLRGSLRRRADDDHSAGRHDRVGLAHSAARGLRRHSAGAVAAPLARRDGSVQA
jgi:hypothetical protein